MVGIYKITNLVNNKVYIGQSVDIERRFSAHRNKPFSKGDHSYNTLFYRAIRKHGLENFRFEVLEECLPSQLDKLEKEYIAQYKSFRDEGYNSTEGGRNGTRKIIYSEEVIDNIIAELKKDILSITEIAEMYNMAISSVSMINSGQMRYRDKETYPIRNTNIKSKPDFSKNRVLCKCGRLKWKTSKLCLNCYKKENKNRIPLSKNELLLSVATLGFTEVGRRYSVSANCIKKWCIVYKLPSKIADIQKLYGNYVEPKQPLTNRKTDSDNRPILVVAEDKSEKTYRCVNDFADWLVENHKTNTGHRQIVQSIRRVLRKERKSYLGYLIFWYEIQ